MKQVQLLLLTVCFALCILGLSSKYIRSISTCKVTIVGGSTSAFAAAISSAAEGVPTCLLEPTDWVGGQLTANGVPAVDFAWHTVKDPITNFSLPVWKIDQDKPNVTPSLWNALHSLNTTGRCWVSPFCFPPLGLLQTSLWPLQNSVSKYLTVYLNTVVKNVTLNQAEDRITSLLAIQRKIRSPDMCDGWDIFASQDIQDWYNPLDSNRWSKNLISFESSIYMDSSNWGELLPLSKAPYLIGIDERWDGDVSGLGGPHPICGQSVSYDFIQSYHTEDTYEPPNPYPVHHPSDYSLAGFSWDKVWTYRRIRSEGEEVQPKDVTLQNWGNGNDYVYEYLLMGKNESERSVARNEWEGGVNVSVLRGAEWLSYGYHYWYKAANPALEKKIVMAKWNSTIEWDRINSFGTCHGLNKLPYMRDSRRTIGLGHFVVVLMDIVGNATALTGNQFIDRVAIGAYDTDIHEIPSCPYKLWMKKAPKYGVLPFFIPFRALTNVKIKNMLVTGLSMAQSFTVNAATRLHPVEWSGGTAGGVIAAWMVNNGVNATSEVLPVISKVRQRINLYTPTAWTIDGKLYPPTP